MDFKAELQRVLAQRERVLVVGLGISGIETASFCVRVGIPATCIERMSEQEYRSRSKHGARIEELRAAGVLIHFGVDGEAALPYADKIKIGIISPGVSHDSTVYGALKHKGLHLISELELGVELYRDFHHAESIVVTGSNGKSTTVSLTDHILRQAGYPSVLCGNVGIPVVSGLSGEVLATGEKGYPQVLVVEASSYQLEACTVLKPNIAVLLNLSDNHLERHGTMERYLEAKLHCCAMQGREDHTLLNADDPWIARAAETVKSKILWFGRKTSAGCAREGVFFEYDRRRGLDRIEVSIEGNSETLDLAGAKLMGEHNRYDIAASLASALLLGVPPGRALQAVGAFKPLEHRLELIKTRSAGIIINDSKSTTVAAACAAFSCVAQEFPDKRITLLLGGLAKAGSWEPLMSLLKQNGKQLREVVCFGKDGRLLAGHCSASNLPHRTIPTLKEAAELTAAASRPDEAVLLSPGCASFDEFTDFEDRGEKFKQYVGASE